MNSKIKFKITFDQLEEMVQCILDCLTDNEYEAHEYAKQFLIEVNSDD